MQQMQSRLFGYLEISTHTKGNEVMNYEQFSPEAKQAIEHLRKFLIANKIK